MLVWRKQEDSFLSEHTLFPGEDVRAFFFLSKMFFVGVVTEGHLCSDDHICLYKPGYRPLKTCEILKVPSLFDNGKNESCLSC